MATATAVVTFSASGPDSQAFTWTPTLTSNPPKVTSASVQSTSGQPCSADIVGAPTNVGGTVRISAQTDCVVRIEGSD